MMAASCDRDAVPRWQCLLLCLYSWCCIVLSAPLHVFVAEVAKLQALPLPRQVQWGLLKVSLSRRLAHLQRL